MRQRILVVSLSALLLSGCSLFSKGDKQNSPSTPTVINDANQVSIELSVEKVMSGLELSSTSADSSKVELLGCASGYTRVYENTEIFAYKGDRNCYLKLVEFSLNGVAFVENTSSPFDTFSVGDTAEFIEKDKIATPSIARKLDVSIIETLSEILGSDENARFSFTEIRGGFETVVVSDSTVQADSLINGTTAPNFEVANMNLVGISPEGAGQFDFLFHCKELMVGNACSGVATTSIDYILVKDIYNGVLDEGQIEALFASNIPRSAGPETIMAGDLDPIPNGGFQTFANNIPVEGPAPMAFNLDMIIILRNQGVTTSYSYYAVKVEPLGGEPTGLQLMGNQIGDALQAPGSALDQLKETIDNKILEQSQNL